MPLLRMECGNCGSIIMRNPELVKKNKSKKAFCSRSCSATYRLKNRKRRRVRKRSRIEAYLKTVIENNYEYEVQNNVRNVLPSGYELDIYLPELMLAVEVNGPTHYEPIYGEASLRGTQARDAVKVSECKAMGITLIVLNINQQHYSFRAAKKNILHMLATDIDPFIPTKIVKVN